MLLKAIPVLGEQSDLAEFALGPEPIIKLAAWETAALEVDFVSTAPDLVVILQSLISLAFRCHAQALPFS
jgi:hypothetical protein